MQWTKIDITTTTLGIEPVGAAVLELGLGGLQVQDAADFESFLAGNDGRWDYIDDELMKLRGAATIVTVYVAENAQGADQVAALMQSLERLRYMDGDGQWGALTVSISSLAEEDWAFGWKKYYRPRKIGDRLVICPSWEQYAAADGEVVVQLDPGMAFGTGTHESTMLCMRLMERYIHGGERVLDMGCGSGILAVSALLLGAKEAIGVDIEEVAVRVSNENAALNAVAERARFICGSLDNAVEPDCKFDVIFANIVADVIIAFLPAAKARLASGGVIITSGIIDTRQEDVLAAVQDCGLTIVQHETDNGWVALVVAGE